MEHFCGSEMFGAASSPVCAPVLMQSPERDFGTFGFVWKRLPGRKFGSDFAWGWFWLHFWEIKSGKISCSKHSPGLWELSNFPDKMRPIQCGPVVPSPVVLLKFSFPGDSHWGRDASTPGAIPAPSQRFPALWNIEILGPFQPKAFPGSVKWNKQSGTKISF